MGIELTEYLHLMAQRQASDIIFSAGAPPSIKIDGETSYLGKDPLDPAAVHDIAYAMMSEKQQRQFEHEMEMNLALSLSDIGRYRINIYRQRGHVAVAVRYISNNIPGIEALNLPPILHDLIMLQNGLVLMVGGTGSGKSTTLAAMIEYRNRNRSGHILTVEEPIEYEHVHRRSIVDQREVGLDTLSYASALKNAMREAPDVIMIGEIRDRETMQAAMAYAETGHLCLSTLHANNANQALDRIINFFPDSAHHQLFVDLSLNLKGVISQRLLRGTDGKRVPAVEILLSTPYVASLIEKGELSSIKEAMKQSGQHGMLTFDDSLYELYASGRISYADALSHADSHTDLALRVRLEGPAPTEGEHELDNVGLLSDDDEETITGTGTPPN
ncbi:PilT/PilU family type 4a pilus ATPase [Oleiagrimonas sp. MCCC 1A03011]|uniref:PilT/PilU family type 4a pilus ATPase n=1 Tax=Oleiagrimonas sp. MCCC 1A03011 TaxID=1926883 RepID=UPI000DD72F87